MPNTILKRWNPTLNGGLGGFEELYPKTSVGQIAASGTASSSTFLRGDGQWAVPAGVDSYVNITGDTMSGQLTSTVATGTAPFVIASTTRVSNLNVATAGTADILTTARTIGIGTGAAGTATSFNGSANITIPITGVSESYLTWGGKHLNGQVTPIGMSLSNELSANRIAFINGAGLDFEYSADSGTTWTNYNYTATQKSQWCTTAFGVPVGRISGEYFTTSRTRVTLTAQNGTTGYVYTNPRKMLINVASSGGMDVLVETRTGVNFQSSGAWSTVGTYSVSGWSGWNDIPLVLGTLGGGTTQTGNNWQLRLTFIMTSKNTTYPTVANVEAIRIFGENAWQTPSTLANTNDLYSFDMSQNAFFPGTIQGTRLISTIATGTSPLAVTSTTAVTNLNADLLDGLHSSAFLRKDIGDVAVGNHEFYATATSGNYDTAAIEIREVNLVTNTQTADAYAPSLSWHWGGITAMKMFLAANGQLNVAGTTSGQIWHSGNDGASSGLDADLLDGNHASAFAAAVHTHDVLSERGTITYGLSGLQWNDTSGVGGTGLNGAAPNNPTNEWWHHLIMNHGNATGYYVDIAAAFHTDDLYLRRNTGGTLSTWRKIWNEGNDGIGSGLDADLLDGNHASAFALASHSHVISDVTNLQTSLDGKANLSGATFTGAVSLGSNKITAGRLAISTDGIQPNWEIVEESNKLKVQAIDGNTNPYYDIWHSGNDGASSGLDADLLDGNHAAAFALAAHSHAISDVTGLQTAIDARIPLTQKGAASGVVPLNASSKIEETYLPNFIFGGMRYISSISGNTTAETLLDSAQSHVASNGGTVSGCYFIVSGTTTVTITGGADTNNGVTHTFSPGPINMTAEESDNVFDTIDLEPGDWLIINETWGPYFSTTYQRWSVVNNTYALVTTSAPGIMSAADKTKLEGIEASANNYSHPTNGANSTISNANGLVLSSITVNTLGHVTSVGSKTLAAADIPTLNQNTTGSAATLTTARTLTIGSTGKTFNGSANVSWSLAEIGAQAAGSYAATSHTHTIADVTNLQTSLDAKLSLAGGTIDLNTGTTSRSITFNTAQTFTGPYLRGSVQNLQRGYYTDQYTIWDAGNDGPGSGLDADTVDGIQASSFALAITKYKATGTSNTSGVTTRTAVTTITLLANKYYHLDVTGMYSKTSTSGSTAPVINIAVDNTTGTPTINGRFEWLNGSAATAYTVSNTNGAITTSDSARGFTAATATLSAITTTPWGLKALFYTGTSNKILTFYISSSSAVSGTCAVDMISIRAEEVAA
jgi:hypothetical protein